MTKALTNYDKIKISTAHVFLQYNQATMIHKYSLDYNSDWLYITFINRTYRINRKTGSVQWSDNDFEIIHEANHNEAMTKLATTSSTGGLSLALQRAIVTARPKGRYRKHFYWPAIKRYYWNLLFSIPLLAHLYISELLHLLYCRLFQHNIL